MLLLNFYCLVSLFCRGQKVGTIPYPLQFSVYPKILSIPNRINTHYPSTLGSEVDITDRLRVPGHPKTLALLLSLEP